MATVLSYTCSQLNTPHTAIPSFIDHAQTCDHLASALGESDDTTWNQTLCNQLYASLEQLQPGLLEPIPTGLIDHFIVDTPPANSPYFDADCTELCRYCMALSTVLCDDRHDADTELALRDLLVGLTAYFVEGMMAPRWVKGAEGIDAIAYV